MRRLAMFAAAFGAAVVLSVYGLPTTVGLICGAVLAVLGLAAALLRRDAAARVSILCFGLAVGLAWTPVYRSLFVAPVEALAGQTATFRATVLDYPADTGYGSAMTVKLTDDSVSAKTVLYLDDDAMDLAPGDVLSVTARVVTAASIDNDYAQAAGAFLVAYGDEYRIMVAATGRELRHLPVRLNHAVQGRIREIFPEDAVALMTALLTGDKSGLSDSQAADLKISGVYHVVAVSGMHVAIFMGFLGLLVRRKRWRAILGIPMLAAFWLFMGNAPGVTRAVLMQAILLAAALLQRDYDPPTALGMAALVMLGCNPWAVKNVGFQLSFAATAGILLFATRIYRAINSSAAAEQVEKFLPLTKITGNPLLNTIAAAVATSLGALAFSTPLMAYYYGRVSVVGIGTNLLVMWAVSVCFTLGFVAVLLSYVLLPLGRGLAWLCAWPVRYFSWVTGLVAKVPFASVSVTSPYILAWLVFVYLLVILLIFGKGRKRPLLPLCAAVLTLCVCLLLSNFSYTASDLTFSALDVGQGQCLAVHADGVNVVIDCGGDGDAGETAAQFLLAAGQTELDALVLTHFDSDHCSGVASLLRRVPTAVLYVPDVEDDAGNRAEILAAAADCGTEVCFVTADTTLSFGESTLQIFAPVLTGSDNEACLSALFQRGDFTALVTGDMDQKAERRLLLLHDLPTLSVLVVGHHGSKNSTGEALLTALSPALAVISVGENSYGHPTAETLARLADAGTTVYRTDQCGTVTFRR